MAKSFRQLVLRPLIDANPITVQALGICSALAVTAGLSPSLLMAVAVIAVSGFASATISLFRRVIPQNIRLIVQIVVIATFVVVVDELLKAYFPETSKRLSVYVFLIVTNCIVLARVESFAMHNQVWPSFVDGIGNGFGYGLVLAIVGSLRELFGGGSLMDVGIFALVEDGGWYTPNGLLRMAPSAFFIIALLIWLSRTFNPEQVDTRDDDFGEQHELDTRG